MRILLVVHGLPPAANGGTEIYTHDLALALARQTCAEPRGAEADEHVFVLTREADRSRPELAVRWIAHGRVTIVAINNTFQACTTFEESYTNPALRARAAAAIDEIQPDVAHIQHLTCLSTGIVDELAARGIPVVMTLNDYWLICHRGQLLDLADASCAGPFDGGCRSCIPAGMLAGPLAYRSGRVARALPIPGAAAAVRAVTKVIESAAPDDRLARASAARLAHMQSAARHIRLFLAPSDTLAAEFRRFGIPQERLRRCNQGIDLRPFAHAVRTPSSTLRVGFAGGLSPSKAPHVLLTAIGELSPGSVTVDLLGQTGVYHGSSDYVDALAPLLKHPAIRRLGPVPHERMASALADLDVLVMPSIWRENAPFTIREAFAAGVPVVASNFGGMAEMVRDDVDGLLFPPGDAGALAACLRRLAGDPALVERLRRGIDRPMSIDADAAQLMELYAEYVEPRRVRRVEPKPRPDADPGPAIAAVVLNYRTPEQTRLAVGSLHSSRVRPGRIVVVDNGSQDGSDDALRRSLSGVEIVGSPENLGFPGGCNLGIHAALAGGARHVLLVNSDVVLGPDALGHMLAALESHGDVGIVAPILLSREEPDHIASAGIRFSTATGRMRHRGAGMPMSLLPPGTVLDVDAVSGCVMLIRREVFEAAGLLDEAYFFSFEDIDFCLRARAAGFRTAIAQEALAYHEGARTIGRRSPRRVYFATRNHLRLARRAGAPSFRGLRSGFIVGLNAAYVLLAPDAPVFTGLGAVARGTWHHLMGRYGSD